MTSEPTPTVARLQEEGRVASRRGDRQEAEELYRRSLEISLQRGDEGAAAIAFHQLGILAQSAGRFDEAERLYRQSLEINRRHDDQSGEAASLGQLGVLAEELGRFDEAERLYRRSLEISLQRGDEGAAAIAFHQLGILVSLLVVLTRPRGCIGSRWRSIGVTMIKVGRRRALGSLEC